MSKQKDPYTDLQVAQMVKHSAHQIWLAGLGAFIKAQQEHNNMFDELVAEGEAAEKRCREDKQNCHQHLPKPHGSWHKIESNFEERVAQTINRLGLPSRQELQALNAQVEILTEHLKQLQARPAHKEYAS